MARAGPSEVHIMTRDLASTGAASSTRLRWGRIVVGAFLLEIVLIAVLIPPMQIFGLEKVIPFVSPAVFIFGFVVAWWMLRRVSHRPVMHGTMIGIVATAIYLLLALANPDGISSIITAYGPITFIMGNGLRILGCAAGGYVVGRRGAGAEAIED
jgi:hypothetical protein